MCSFDAWTLDIGHFILSGYGTVTCAMIYLYISKWTEDMWASQVSSSVDESLICGDGRLSHARSFLCYLSVGSTFDLSHSVLPDWISMLPHCTGL